MKIINKLLLLVSVSLVSLGNSAYALLPGQVDAQFPLLHPEGVEWDSKNYRFLVSSVFHSGVFQVDDFGVTTPFSQHTSLAPSAIGIHIDKYQDRVLVAFANPYVQFDPTQPSIAEVGVYDLDTGEEISLVSFTGMLGAGVPQLANDLTSDPEGNIYVTDWFAGVVYKVDTAGNASVFVNFGDPTIAPNGIDYHPDGYLLVARPLGGSLMKVPVNDPNAYSFVNMGQPIAMDGVVVNKHGDIAAVANTFDSQGGLVSEIITLHSADDWSNAEIVSRGSVANPELGPTTLALRNIPFTLGLLQTAYVVTPDYNALLAFLEGGEPAVSFRIERIEELQVNGFTTICFNGNTRLASLYAWDNYYSQNGGTLGACQ